MTPEDDAQLQIAGFTIQTNFVGYLTNTLLHGMFLLLFGQSTVIILNRGLKGWPAWAMLTITVVSFLLSTLYWAANTAVTAFLIQGTMIDNAGLPIGARLGIGFVDGYAPHFITVWTSLILPILSDIVVFWRAWVLFPRQRWLMILPFLLLLGTTSVSIAFIGLAKNFAGLATTANRVLFDNLLLSSIILSMVTNAVSTLLIIYKLWTHRKLAVNLARRRRSYVEKVLVVFIETGIFYCGLQLAALCLNLTPPVNGTTRGYVEAVVYSIYTELSSMYPTVVVVLVNQHRSFVDTFGLTDHPENQDGRISGARAGMSVSGHLSFAVPPTETSNDISLAAGSGGDWDRDLAEKKSNNESI